MTWANKWTSNVHKETLSLDLVALIIIDLMTDVTNSDALMWQIGNEAIVSGVCTQHLMQRGTDIHQVASFWSELKVSSTNRKSKFEVYLTKNYCCSFLFVS